MTALTVVVAGFLYVNALRRLPPTAPYPMSAKLACVDVRAADRHRPVRLHAQQAGRLDDDPKLYVGRHANAAGPGCRERPTLSRAAHAQSQFRRGVLKAQIRWHARSDRAVSARAGRPERGRGSE